MLDENGLFSGRREAAAAPCSAIVRRDVQVDAVNGASPDPGP